jgi:hypothetical protein
MEHHLTYFLRHEGEGPLKDVHEVWQQVRMLHFGILLQEKLLLTDAQAGSLVVVEVTVVRSREDGDYTWKFILSRPFEQPISVLLCLVAPHNTSYLILP